MFRRARGTNGHRAQPVHDTPPARTPHRDGKRGGGTPNAAEHSLAGHVTLQKRPMRENARFAHLGTSFDCAKRLKTRISASETAFDLRKPRVFAHPADFSVDRSASRYVESCHPGSARRHRGTFCVDNRHDRTCPLVCSVPAQAPARARRVVRASAGIQPAEPAMFRKNLSPKSLKRQLKTSFVAQVAEKPAKSALAP